jgi:sterol 3beta-glucosyltransferase
MHYGIVALGSRGDVQPFVGLALGLLDRGHRVTLMAHENFKDFVEGYGIDYHPLPGDVEAMLYTPRGQKVVRSGNMLIFMRFVQKEVAKNQSATNEAIIAGSQKADVIVTSVLGMIWVDAIAERMGKRWATVQLSFPTTATGEYPFILLDFLNAPLYNRFTYRVFDLVYTRDYGRQLDDFRRSLGLPPKKGPLLRQMNAGDNPNIYAISPLLLPRPSDWPDNTQVVGFIHLPPAHREQNPQDRIPAELVRWLEAGPAQTATAKPDHRPGENPGAKPIYIGFGSIPVTDPERLKKILEDLLTQTSYRFIFCQGWSRITGLPQHPRLFIAKTVNHDWLFPRCRAAIIHGGVGTTAAALKAKLPVIVASIFADQPFWGKLVQRRGLGVHLPFKSWTTERVVAAIRAIESPEIQQRATELGDRMNHENGLQQTIEALEKYFGTFLF